MSSKKSAKPAAKQQQVQPKPKSTAAKSSNWLVRPSTETEQDPLLKKIFAAAGIAILLTTIILALGSGINADDEYQNDYSQRLVRHYGGDEAALQIDSTAKDPYNKGKMYFYGGVFDLLSGLTNAAFGNDVLDQGYHDVRHVFNAIFGFLAMLFTALLAREIAGWRAGILTLVLMFLSPRFLGHSLMNPKDIPFAAGYVIALYYMVLLFRQMPKPTWKTALGLALGIGLAIGTRAGGMILFAYLGLFAGIDFLMKRGTKGTSGDGQMIGKYAVWGAGAAAAGFVIALLFWPYAMQSPFSHPFDALGEFSKLGVKIRVLFKGENVMSDQTSWDYPVQWIWRTIPLFTLLGFVGSLVLLKKILDRYAV
ncbi:MAG: phospholipid carrier-dependent glycosyltransferase, partial [Bacteroidota bacterium]